MLLGYPSNNHTFMPSIGSLCVGSFYLFNFLPYNHSPEKWRFPALKSLLLPQFSTNRHQTGFIVKRKQVRITNYLSLPINWLLLFFFFLKLMILPQKNTHFSKHSTKFIIHFFSKRDNWAYLCINAMITLNLL